MMKIMGLILLFASCTGAGCLKSMQLAEEVRLWERFLRFVLFVENTLRGMQSTTTELTELYHTLHPEDPLTRMCCSRCRNGQPFPEAWVQSVEQLRAGWGLSPEGQRILMEFGAGLGTTDVEGQLNHAAAYRLLGQEQRTAAAAAQTQKARMYVMLGAALGLGLDLMLL